MDMKIALLLDLPEGKIPGFYAQIVKALAGKAQLFDRDKELLIVSTEEQKEAVLDIMSHYHVETEEMQLLLLPKDAELTNLFSDYGFTSRADHSYLYAKLIRVFRFTQDHPDSEREQAIQQMEEHRLASFQEDGAEMFAVDRQLEELMQGIAKAYRTEIEFVF